MHQHKKVAFLKFFITYFVSVALLILVAGFFYFNQTKEHFLKAEEFLLIKYARYIKMQDAPNDFTSDYHHEYVTLSAHTEITNFSVEEKEFSKLLPMHKKLRYLKVYKSKENYDARVYDLKLKVIALQAFLLLLFAYLSYLLAKSALKPLEESINTLDKFAKDLIHDLNTPVTSIKLNMKLLKKLPEFSSNSALLRLNKSVHNISELHENLTILLQEETFQIEELKICEIVDEVVQMQQQIYPEIAFTRECSELNVRLNKNATKQILQNIISNACKYNSKNGSVKIYVKEKKLYIEDSGGGIKEPSRIFERSYSEENSSGIGLDIVKRLAAAMDIKIAVNSSDKGSCFILEFNI
ncbi:sensor histidine kinase [Sulfurimonas aquatica]|uniref:Sensor histidine kinase n=1 Tax=Sulfurimonas aquatica TaxID=2672570 RepID=A0A975AY66_9BACT|nr:HAMP domain-containing sensor histidine kinase [Sulfurimonas aquatica]QSZ40668.1 sensor histidine kinase [Sulfurimonas aquatica]